MEAAGCQRMGFQTGGRCSPQSKFFVGLCFLIVMASLMFSSASSQVQHGDLGSPN